MNSSLKSVVCRFAYSPIGDAILTHTGIVYLSALSRVRKHKKGLLKEAEKFYSGGGEDIKGSYEDFKNALNKHWVSYSEYAHQYEFYKLSEPEREEFVARLRMAYFYWRYAPGNEKAVFRNKPKFLKKFNKFVNRKWLYTPDASFEDFEQMIKTCDCIIKPSDGKLGRGVFKVKKGEKLEQVKALYDSCVKSRAQIEECIVSCEELKAFHPQSLNTIRVVTISNKKKAEVFGSFLRTGVGGSVVDNAHAGGIFAQINIKEGVIESDGINTDGAVFVKHPDSNLVFKGTKIPHWDTIVKTCCEAALMSGNPITGWDVAINQDGAVEFVEGNYGPDFDVMQSPMKVGVKKRIYGIIKSYFGIEMR